MQVQRCRSCSLMFQQPQPPDDVLKAIYHDAYALENSFGENRETFSRMKELMAMRYLEFFQENLLARQMIDGAATRRRMSFQGLKLLEVGCGSGHFLSEARKAGFEVQGIEISPHAAKIAGEKIGLEAVSVGSLETVAFKAESFDICVLIDVIEHLREPAKALRTINRLLKPGGVLFLVTPSTDSLSFKVMKRNWMEFKQEHLYYFGDKNIRLLLEKEGFSGIFTTPSRKLLNLEYLLCHCERFSSRFLAVVSNIIRKWAPKVILDKQVFLPSAGMWVLAARAARGAP